MKLMIFLGVTIGAIIGGWLGAVLLDGGNWFGGWSVLLSGVGSFVGLWAGYRVGQNFN